MSKYVSRKAIKRNPTVSELLNTINRIKDAYGFDCDNASIELCFDKKTHSYMCVMITTHDKNGTTINLADYIESEKQDGEEFVQDFSVG